MNSPFLYNGNADLTNLHLTSFSVAFWIKPTTTEFVSITDPILISEPAFQIRLLDDGTIAFLTNQSSTSTETPVVSSNAVAGASWNFVVVVYDAVAGTMTVYVNGISTSVSSVPSPDSVSNRYTATFNLGSNSLQDSFSVPASFALDSTTVWNRALTGDEAAVLYALGAGMDYPFSGGAISLIFQATLTNEDTPVLVLGSNFQLLTVARNFDSVSQSYQAITTILASCALCSQGYPWYSDNFIDSIVFAQHDNPALMWTPPLPAVAVPIPGLPIDDDIWDGVCTLFGHVVLWKGDRLKWSDLDDFSIWIPVAETVQSEVLTTTAPFNQPNPTNANSTVVVNTSATVTAVKSISIGSDLTFDDTSVGDTSLLDLVILNTGSAPITISSISTVAAPFSTNFSGTTTIAAGSALAVIVTYKPTTPGSVDTVWTIASDATQGTSTVPVHGNCPGTTRIISLGGTLDFGRVRPLPAHTLTSDLIITNTGNTALVVSSLSLPNHFTSNFGSSLSVPAPTAPATFVNRIVELTFNPTVAATYDGIVKVTSNATSGAVAGISEIAVTAACANTLGGLTLFMTDNGSCQFGWVSQNTSVTGTLRLYNLSVSPLHVRSLAMPPGFAGSFTGDIAANSYHDVTVTFTPTDAAGYGGMIIVDSNAVLGITSLQVSGTGYAAGKVISISGNLSFGPTVTGNTPQAAFYIKNTGSDLVTIDSITVPTGYTVSPSAITAIAAGTTQTILITFSPVAVTDYNGNVTITSDADGSPLEVPITGSGISPLALAGLVAGQFVYLTDVRPEGTFYDFYTVVTAANGVLTLKPMNLTGATSPGKSIKAGATLFTVDANEAGETHIAGSNNNGPIFQIFQSGDYGYVFKERSIQSIQYAGITSGTFVIHNEMSGEGPISRRAITLLNDGRMVFLGHRELFLYTGGPSAQPVCQQYTRQLYAELDRTRLYQLILFNNESRGEVWIQYPVTGGFKVLVWNYIEDSAAIDEYDPELGGFTAFGIADWANDPTWDDLRDDQTWDNTDSSITWDSMVASSVDHVTLVATARGDLFLHGLVFNRGGQGYPCLSETMDYDLGQSDLWKYLDVVTLGLRIVNPTAQLTDTPKFMYVSVGFKDGLASEDIRWSLEKAVRVDGLGKNPLRINPGGSGRFMRLRFRSQDADVDWRVAEFAIHCRPGSWY